MAGTLVYLETHDGELTKGGLGVLSKAASLGGDVSGVVLGSGLRAAAASAGAFGASTVYVVDDEALAAPRGCRGAGENLRERDVAVDHFARGSGRNWKCAASGFVPLPPSISHGVRSPLAAHRPRPFQPAFGSSMRPSNPFA